jgi:ketosteroid isomerase-like protein
MTDADQNVKRTWDAFEAFARSGLESVLDEFFDPDIEFHDTRGLPDADVYRGHAGLRRAYRQWFAPWERFTFDLQGASDVGADRVLATVQARGVAKETRLELDRPLYVLLTFRRGKIVSGNRGH